ncbi:MAG: hypothetical protein J0I34_26540 [Pseudonocardia sp.]|uniref:hypothetical protein n=1 Tax=unclassified Pseudonocardia TaxID=2619320 RepID=UPI00086D5581|nr:MULTISPECIES: hypothetical protein [unclassified Pseudonocardia]MBN9112331.1 hypothetical protein [Pseudonocardia sp.]ODU24257.1 MAG: hypothetical protein ABS80_13065 [Pseudonocardia sp. SCN 72-51]ODV09004.1 MAG: hypothetical protein ABT15_01835 [Pseudonocardia sp. SCN 73-27]
MGTAPDRTTKYPYTAGAVQYGLGILQLGDWVGHNGSIFGYSDMVDYLPSARASVVVMVNAANAEATPSMELWCDIVRLLHPDSLPAW